VAQTYAGEARVRGPFDDTIGLTLPVTGDDDGI
jgi:hypothetical protein